MKTELKRTMAFVLLITSFGLITSCGGGLSGTYKAKAPMGMGSIELNFVSSNKVQVSTDIMSKATREFDCEKDGKEVKLKQGSQVQILTINSDGCLEGMGTKFCKE